MLKLLKGAYCYTPCDAGIKDILIVRDRIFLLEDSIPEDFCKGAEVVDCTGKLICPGFIDQHAHIIGGGGEQGPASRIREMTADEIISAGITTIVGVLGLDDMTRSISSLLAKARALEMEGVHTHIYTGSYSVPPATLTGSVAHDVAFIDKVLGVGEIAISDYRSSHPSYQELKKLASEALKGGMVGAKPGVVHLHVGDGREGLLPLTGLLEESEFPIGMFVPTHLNRNKVLFLQALEFARKGGWIDFTAGESGERGLSVPDAISSAIRDGILIEQMTVSSDGNGSDPNGGAVDGLCKVGRLLDDVRSCILDKGLNPGQALKIVTSNVARILKLYPRKGALKAGSDADILVLSKEDFRPDKVISAGNILMDGGVPVQENRIYQRTDKNRKSVDKNTMKI